MIHLHVHSDFSILDAAISVEKLAENAARLGMPKLALTDHGNVHGWVKFAKACKKHGVQPIFGVEAYVARRSSFEKMDKFSGNATDHLVLLAKNDEGYKNILRLVTASHDPARFHYTPRIDLDLLAQHSEGIIATTACLSGGTNRLLAGWQARNPSTKQIEGIAADYAGARVYAGHLREIFGPQGFFLEIQHHAGAAEDAELIARQKLVIEGAYRLGTDLGIPLVATNDIHFERPEHAAAREMAFLIGRGKANRQDVKHEIAHAGEFYFKSTEEMQQAFRIIDPAPLQNTLWIAEQCNVEMELGVFHFPEVIIDGKTLTEPEIHALWERLIQEGIRYRYPNGHTQEVLDRVAFEKEVIERMGFVPYFIMVWDTVNFARSQGIPVGPGRGSVAGCLIAYLLRIHDTDTLRFHLLFERFLNPDRVSMPDVDLDFCKSRRGEVIQYLVDKYGHDHAAQIATFGNFWAKSVIRETGKFLEMDPYKVEELAKALPDSMGDFRTTIGEALENVPVMQALKASTDPKDQQLIQLAQGIEGIKRAVSTHACGLVIADKPLTEYTALMPVKRNAVANLRQCQFDMVSLEDIGLLKLDALGLDALTVLARAEAWVRERHDPDFHLADDREYASGPAWDLIRSGRVLGLFQIETGPMRELVMRAAPSCLEDLAAVVALYRPGPLDFKMSDGLSMVDHYVLRKQGMEPATPPHPALSRALESTYGIILYQEQIIRIAKEFCGFTPGNADKLRKAVGKKKKKDIEEQRAKFIPAAMSHSNVTQSEAESIWDMIEKFGRYGFNISHATSYAIITYYTAKMKALYPLEFMAARLTSSIGVQDLDDAKGTAKNNEDLVKYVDECNRLGIKVLSVDVNRSVEGFEPEGNAIRAGLCAIKGLGASASNVLAARAQTGGSFRSFREMVRACVGAGAKANDLSALILSGACRDLGETNEMLAVLEEETKVSRQEVKQVGLNAPSFLEIPTSMPKVAAMPLEQQRAYSLDLVGAYDVDDPEPALITCLMLTHEGMETVGRIAAAHPGNIPLKGRFLQGDTKVDLDFGKCKGTVVVALKKAGIPVKENA